MNIFIPEKVIEICPIIAAFIISFTLLIVILIKQSFKFKRPLNVAFIGIISLSTIWTFSYFMRYISENNREFITWIYVEYICHVFIGIVWIGFSLLFVKKGKFLKRFGVFLAVPPVISYILLLTNSYHYLFFNELAINNIDKGFLWYFPHMSVSYAYIAWGIILLLVNSIRSVNTIDRRKSIIVLLGALVPLIGNIFDTLLNNYIGIHIDLTPAFFTFSNLFFGAALLRYKLFSLKPILFNELMKSIQSMVFIFNFENVLMDTNDYTLKFMDKSKKELVDSDINQICKKLPSKNNSIKKYIIENKEVNNKLVEVIYPDIKYFNLSISHIKDKKGNIVSKVVILNDITEIQKSHDEILSVNKKLNKKSKELTRSNKELENSQTALVNIMEDLKDTTTQLEKVNKKLSEVDNMRKEFVSHTAHELRTPLNATRWTLEMLLNEDVGRVNRSQREFIDQLYKSNIRLLGLVEDLLEVSKIDQKRFKIIISQCQIENLIDQVLGEMSIKVREKNINIGWDKNKYSVPKIKADCDRIIQVLINIIGNAVKYTEAKGEINIELKVTNNIAPSSIARKYKYKSKNIKYILCKISDNGIGIPSKEQNKMFDRFFRASNALSSEENGTGLGMTITKKIIDLHKGAIWFESEKNKGTTFYFTLPALK